MLFWLYIVGVFERLTNRIENVKKSLWLRCLNLTQILLIIRVGKMKDFVEPSK
jgi:hypothetical protein